MHENKDDLGKKKRKKWQSKCKKKEDMLIIQVHMNSSKTPNSKYTEDSKQLWR